MLRITVELLPFGNEEKKEVIGYGEVINTTTKMRKGLGDYNFHIEGRGIGDIEEIDMGGEIKGWRREEKNVWYLIKRILNKLPKMKKKNKVIEDRETLPLFPETYHCIILKNDPGDNV